MVPRSLFVICACLTVAFALPALPVLPSGYAPIAATCPATPLVRPATGISSGESSYLASRKAKASTALSAWLEKTNSGFGTTNLPTVALTTSGGGYRSLLSGAGVIQGFDSRDSNVGTSGVYQGLTYQAGLSGGAWLLSSFAGNNYPTISSLKNNLWKPAFQDSLLLPDNLLAATAYAAVTNDILAKEAAGFPPTLTDPWGRLLSYQLLYGTDGGVSTRLSSISTFSNYTTNNVPFPIITSLGVKTFQGECLPGPNATTYELTPLEFGSFDQGVSAFTQTAYLGTALSNGVPSNGTCIMNYDNLGYVLGTSSNLFNEACESVPTASNSSVLDDDLAAIVNAAHALSTRDEYAVYPNPFHNYARSTLVEAQTSLTLVDGGEALQNNPIFPLLQPSRGVNVIIVNDNSADTSTNFPNGSEILTTYVQSLNAGLTRMPFIPSVATFISEGLNKRPTFFGCNDTSKITIVYLPNVNYTFPSNEPTAKLQYSEAETEGMVDNGIQIATMGGSATWPTCLGCAIMMKAGDALPTACTTCFSTYCYTG
ncbi:MAG: hypothetical protein M1827_003633 [Pycnora praestabilis]|nr:MAG: hypothetical protein M1827_003633 [Pycnora praestabilis]